MFRILLILICCGGGLFAQTPTLDQLLLEATNRYPEVRQRQAELAAARAQLREAEALRSVRVDALGTYTVAAGGRSIDLPVGDLLNPVYGALNQLTQSSQFPSIDNVQEQFLPNNFYDLRLRATYPIYRPEIKIGQSIRRAQVELAETQQAITQRDLRRDIRVAYWQIQSARAAARAYEEALRLIAEGLRTTRSLIANGLALPAARLRLEAERAQVQAELARVQAQAANAEAQLNFLLARPLDTPVPLDTLAARLPDTLRAGTASRSELQQLRTGLAINELNQSLEDLFYRPRVGAQLEAGSQAFNFGFSPYAILGLNVEMPIWDNRMHRHRMDRLTAENQAQSARLEQVQRAVTLEAEVLQNQLTADLQQVARYEPAVRAARRAYRDTERLYREGLINYLNVVDARTSLTQLTIQQTIAAYTAWIRAAELMRALEIE